MKMYILEYETRGLSSPEIFIICISKINKNKRSKILIYLNIFLKGRTKKTWKCLVRFIRG